MSIVTVGEHGLLLNGKEIPIYSGTIHYWHHEPSTWEHLLRQIIDLGFAMVETYIPWGVHELSAGEFDFGHVCPANDLPRFLDLCHQLGLRVCVRPGPHINAELTWFGFPQRVLANPEVWAHTATGAPAVTDRVPQPFPVPSYASEALFRETAGFFDVLCPLLVPRLAPHGPIVACQVDNETCYFFRHNMYDLDYSRDSLALYRVFLHEQYGTIAGLNAAYRSSYNTFANVEPPRDWEVLGCQDIPRHLDWVAYREYQLITALNRIGMMLRKRGIHVPLYHDIAFQCTTPIDTCALEAQPNIDFVGTNLYANQEEYSTIARRVRYQAGSQRLPFIPELGAGVWWSHHRVPTPAEQEFLILTTLMHGLKALNFYMLVERDRWVGSPITRHGDFRPAFADFFRRLSALINDTNLLQTEKRRSVLVLLNYDASRYAAACETLQDVYLGLAGVPAGLGQIAPSLGFRHDPAVLADWHNPKSWLRQAMDALEAAQIEYDIADTHAQPATLARYAVVLAPMADFCDVAEQRKLLAYATDGGQLVVGPALPTLDRQMHPANVLAAVGKSGGTTAVGRGTLSHMAELSQLTAMLGSEHVNAITHDNPALRLTIREGATTLCFLANPTELPQVARLSSPFLLRGLWNTDSTAPGQPVHIAPYTVQIWEILR